MRMRQIKLLWHMCQKRGIASVAKGPDRILPTEALYTWEADGAIKIQKDSVDCLKHYDPISIPSKFRKKVEQYPNSEVLVFNRDNQIRTWSYSDYYRDVETAGKALIRLGLEKYHGACIIGFNAPQWLISFLGAIFAGGLGTGVYITSSAAICRHVGENCKANIFIVENDVQLQKILSIRKHLPHLRAIVQYMGKPTEPGVLSWEEFMELGRGAPDDILQERLETMAINQAAAISYTSGTTGLPKGVLMSHDGILSSTESAAVNWPNFDGGNIFSYLPLNHVAGMFADIILPFTWKVKVHFAKPDVFQGSFISSLREVKPSVLFVVPRMLEKIHEDILLELPDPKQITEEKRKEILSNVGLDKLSLLGIGAAPSSTELLAFFTDVMKIPPLEAYGLTEGGIGTLQTPDYAKLGSVGKFFIPAKIHNPDKDGNGEIRMRGRTLFMGYLGEKEKTLDAIDSEGWLKTGDVGNIDSDGFVYITGRVKELLITSGGENIPPVPIENEIKKEIPALSNCMVIGDKHKYLTALVTLRTNMDLITGQLTDELQPDVVEWCKSLGSEAKSVRDILDGNDQKILTAIQAGVERANSNAMSRAQKVQKWTLLRNDFTMQEGELGPTLKLRRHAVLEKYADEIDSMYK